VTLIAISPILALIGARAGGLFQDSLFALYSMLVLVILATLFYLAFGEYRDPSLDLRRNVWSRG
jgi:hypothetical protein